MVIIIKDDVDETQMAMSAPEGMSDVQAQNAVREAHNKVTEASPEEWDYNQVSDELAKDGFVRLEFTEWAE